MMASGGISVKDESDWERDIQSDEEQRKRTMTEKGLAYKIDMYKKIFKSLKHQGTHIKQMISDKQPPGFIRGKHLEWLKDLEHFMTIHSEICPNLSEDERDKFDSQHEQYDVYISNLKGEIENYFLGINTMVNDEHPKQSKAKSRISNKTSSSIQTVVAERIKEEQKLVTLSAVKRNMAKKRELEMAKLKLKFQEEEIEVNTGLEIAIAKTEILKKYEQAEGGSVEGSIADGLNPNAASYKPPSIHSDKQVNIDNISQADDDLRQPVDTNNNSEQPDSSNDNVRQPSGVNQQSEPQPGSETAHVVQDVVKYLRKPTPEIKKYDGNPMEYHRFIRQFNAKVIQNTETDSERMNYLEQLTSGEANKVVSGFGHLPDEVAYKSAMKTLEERYGDNEVIVAAFVKKAMEWPPIKDSKMLDEFSLFLTECENAASSINSNSVLDFSENIKRLLSKLPVYMHDRLEEYCSANQGK